MVFSRDMLRRSSSFKGTPPPARPVLPPCGTTAILRQHAGMLQPFLQLHVLVHNPYMLPPSTGKAFEGMRLPCTRQEMLPSQVAHSEWSISALAVRQGR